MKLVCLLVGLFYALSWSSTGWSKPPVSQETSEWRSVLDWSRTQHRQAIDHLSKLRSRIEASCLAAKLENCAEVYPPKPYPSGYGLMPRIKPDGPDTERSPYRNDYSLERLTERTALILRDLSLLERLHQDTGDARRSTTEFIRIRQVLDNLDEHIKYHALWQPTVSKHAKWYAKRRYLARQARALMAAVTAKASPEKRAAMGSRIVDGLKPFTPVKHSVSCTGLKNGLTLVMSVHTDLSDQRVVTAFTRAVERYFSGPTPRGRLRVRVDITPRTPASLQGQDEPTVGQEIDGKKHADRFGPRRFVLTSGATSLYALHGRAVFLPSRPLTPRQLAHEAGHLLGFRDVYLRHFTRRKGTRYGVRFHVWAGLENDLMGNSRGGRVSPRMRKRLIDAYCRTR